MSTTAFIEACRSTSTTQAAWFLELTAAAAPLLGAHRGLGGYTYRVLLDGSIAIVDLIHPIGSQLAEHPDYGKAAFLNHINGTPLRACFSALDPVAIVLSQQERRLAEALRPRLPPGGVDSVGLISGAFRREGVSLCCLLDRDLRPGTRKMAYLRALAEHLSAGYRVRRVLATSASWIESAAAVITPEGRVAHFAPPVGGEERASIANRLVGAVRASERLRTVARRRGVAESEALFDAFIAGQYALVDQVDSDGRRWIVAVCVKGHRRSAMLTRRERRVAAAAASGLSNKAIAADIGLSVRAVAYDLRACLAKLGLADRASLVLWWSAGHEWVSRSA